jgi:hypothetical protein
MLLILTCVSQTCFVAVVHPFRKDPHLDKDGTKWEHPTMKVVADQKRRVVLPKPTVAGDIFEVVEAGDRIVLVKLAKAAATPPRVSPVPLDPDILTGIDLDEPAFDPICDASSP